MTNKREARREFKERKTSKGVFALRCTSGETWVSASPNLEAWRTGLFFQLRTGGHINHGLQASWNRHGAGAFQFEVLETLDEDLSPMEVQDTLRSRQKHWQQELNAAAL